MTDGLRYTALSSTVGGAPATAAKLRCSILRTRNPIGSHAVADKLISTAWRRRCADLKNGAKRRPSSGRRSCARPPALRERNESVARAMTMEQGSRSPKISDGSLPRRTRRHRLAGGGRPTRAYGRIVPGRAPNVSQMVIKEPVGPVAAFSPWNFPINQAVRKISAALASGCSIIIKGPKNTPGSCAALVAAFADAGLPPSVLNLVFGDPATISAIIRIRQSGKSRSRIDLPRVGKQLASLAGLHMKRVTNGAGRPRAGDRVRRRRRRSAPSSSCAVQVPQREPGLRRPRPGSSSMRASIPNSSMASSKPRSRSRSAMDRRA